jgi:hypothetical protein
MNRGATLALLALISCPLAAQRRQEPELLLFHVIPLVGYRTGMSFPIEPGLEGVDSRVVFDANPGYGLAFGVRLNDEDLAEFRWTRHGTRIHVRGALAPLTERVTLDQFHVDFSHEYVPKDWRPWARPFIFAGVGFTHVSSTGNFVDFTRPSFGIGGGVRFFHSRHVGFRVQAEWLALWVNPKVRAVCAGGCVVGLGGRLASQGELTIGPVFGF